jgi:hypothetical protein
MQNNVQQKIFKITQNTDYTTNQNKKDIIEIITLTYACFLPPLFVSRLTCMIRQRKHMRSSE